MKGGAGAPKAPPLDTPPLIAQNLRHKYLTTPVVNAQPLIGTSQCNSLIQNKFLLEVELCNSAEYYLVSFAVAQLYLKCCYVCVKLLHHDAVCVSSVGVYASCVTVYVSPCVNAL